MTDITAIREQFLILDQQINGHPLVYLDSGATAQKPQCVIDAESRFYETVNAGVHRGAHTLAGLSTVAFEQARAKVAALVGASAEEGNEELVVTMGATDGLNTLATAFGNASLGRGGKVAERFALKPGDEIVVSRGTPFRTAAIGSLPRAPAPPSNGSIWMTTVASSPTPQARSSRNGPRWWP